MLWQPRGHVHVDDLRQRQLDVHRHALGAEVARRELISELRRSLTIVIVTHSMQQAARVSQTTGFFYLGALVEVGDTNAVFTRPREKQTEDYITGRFG